QRRGDRGRGRRGLRGARDHPVAALRAACAGGRAGRGPRGAASHAAQTRASRGDGRTRGSGSSEPQQPSRRGGAMSMLCIAVIAASVLSFAQKWIGYQAPQDVLEGPRVSRITTLLPVALLGALVATQAAASGTEIVLDARLAGLAAAVVLLVL